MKTLNNSQECNIYFTKVKYLWTSFAGNNYICHT